MTKTSLKNPVLKKIGSWPLDKKIAVFASLLMIVSLFLGWYNDTDVFRTGESYNGLNGPLYLAGYTILAMSLLSFFLAVEKLKFLGLAEDEKKRGKIQILIGFLCLYFLILINSTYFHPKFGLNLLAKKSDIGSMAALICTVLMAVAGYLTFRKGLLKSGGEVQIEEAEEQAGLAESEAKSRSQVEPGMRGGEQGMRGKEEEKIYQINVSQERPKPTAEKIRTYETIKMLMQKDTKTAEQRRKEREQTGVVNAFSKNSGIVNGESADGKKPQMYRMDL